MSTSAKLTAGAVAGVGVATSLLLGACTVSSRDVQESCAGGAPSDAAWNRIDNCVLESQVQAQLTKNVGQQVSAVTCPDELDAEVGAMTTCTFTGAGGTLNVAVTVTSVDYGDVILDDGTPGNFASGNATFDLKVADTPNS